MRRLRLAVAFVALCAALDAMLAFSAQPPDTRVQGHAVLARRGSLGANDYVATNVAPCSSAYIMHAPTDGRLRDRAVNTVSVDTTNAVFALPGRRTAEGYARAFIVAVNSTTNAVLSFTGANGIYSPDGGGPVRVEPGRTMFSFIEIGANEYLLETRDLGEVVQ